MLIATTIEERQPTFITISVRLQHAPDTQHFTVYIDTITNEASVFHQGRTLRTPHALPFGASPDDAQAFAMCAVLSLAFNISEQI